MQMCCPHCGVRGSADNSYEGRQVRCPKCKQDFLATRAYLLDSENSVTEPLPEQVTEQLEEPVKETVIETAAVLETLASDDRDLTSEDLTPEDVIVPEPKPGEYIIERLLEKVDEIDEVEENPVREEEQWAAETIEHLPELPPDLDDMKVPGNDKQGEYFEDDEKLHLETDSLACGRCGKVAVENREYAELEGRHYCQLCALEVQDEISTSAQAAAAVAGTVRAAAVPESQTITDGEQSEGGAGFTISQVLSKAWHMTKGVKWTIWAGLLITYGIMIITVMGLALLINFSGQDDSGLVSTIGEILSSVLSTLLTAGLMYMGVKRAARKTVVWKDIFSGFDVAGKIIFAAILQTILVVIGCMLFILPGIYLMVGYLMTMPLIIDRKLSPWQAMEVSRKAIHTIWWKVFGLCLVALFICSVSAIPMGIGLIWTVPMSVVMIGIVYYSLFGYEKKAD